MTLYRDPLAGLKSQVATKRGLLERRASELAPLIRAMLPPGLRARIDAPRPDDEESIDALTRADAALDALLAAYDEALLLAPTLRSAPLDVPDPPKPKQRPPWLIEEARQLAFRRAFEERLREVAPSSYLVRWGDLTYLARMTVAGAPIVVTARGNFDVQAFTTELTSTLRTSVPDATPRVDLKPMGSLDGIAKALRLARDDETGDAELDESFLVDAPDGGVLLLTPDVTAAILALAAWALPTLHVGRGIAEISWRTTFRGRGPELIHDAAIDVLLGIRAAIERA